MSHKDEAKSEHSAEQREVQFARKVLSASAKMPAPDTFKVWHANSDKEIGTDSPWGTTR
jgi:hypothetical protein